MAESTSNNQKVKPENFNQLNRHRRHCCSGLSSSHPDDIVANSKAYNFTNECQVLENVEAVEADLQTQYNNCKKSPDHANLIPIKSFNIDHLPEGHRDDDLLELIRILADLTVRICVTEVSANRPKCWPNTNVPYPFYNMNASSQPSTRIGSGQLVAYKYVDGKSAENVSGTAYTRDYKTCICEMCKGSANASNVWWEIYVHTAAHVIYDDLEAAHTSCRLFFDEEDCEKTILKTFTMHFVHLEFDISMVKYVTCDSVLGDMLVKKLERFDRLWDVVDKKYANRPDNKLNFIVSHPHGCPKHVSIGENIDIEKVRDHDAESDIAKLSYSTSTCPGSSGARVYCVGFGSTHVHTGVADSKRNCSSIDIFMKL